MDKAKDTSNAMDKNEFIAVFPEIVQALTEYCRPDAQDAKAWFVKVLEYNVPWGKKTRGYTVVQTFKSFAKKEDLTKENLYLAAVLGWCIEMMQATYLVVDDIMDRSETRRGKLCWYKYKHVGLQAVNDALFLENAVFMILRKYFRSKEYYLSLIDLLFMASWGTSTGEVLDDISSMKDGIINFDYYKQTHVDTISKYKTAIYTFFVPVALGMRMAGCTEAIVEKVKPLLLSLGQPFQAQDDYYDCYGDPKITGKIGTDIEDGKCCWMIVKALELASESQKKILMENYGKVEKERVAKVKEVYDELNMTKEYMEYEPRRYKWTLEQIAELQRKHNIPPNIFDGFLSQMYKYHKCC